MKPIDLTEIRADLDACMEGKVFSEHAPALLGLVDLMARALLKIEWEGGDVCGTPVCPDCCADKYPEERRQHQEGCLIDEALRNAGYPNEAVREAARYPNLQGP